ncbi:MAG: 4Fe-4S binding protein [Lachnospiraceae bacterium]|nr:4Fe-4S binding protein [Lachnospiraceae bacterium]
MTGKKNKKKEKILDALIVGIRLMFFLWFPSLFATAFAGIKNLTETMAAGEMLEINSFVKTLAFLLLLTIFAGRIFCGYACAFGSLGDFVYWCQTKIQKQRKKKTLRIPSKVTGILRYMKYLVLAGILMLCWFGKTDFITRLSPWPAFSLIHSRHFSAIPIGGAVLLVLVLIGMAWEPRFFCRFLCPMGAIFSLLPVMPWAVIHRRRSQCLKGCSACSRRCPAGIDIVDQETGDIGNMGECFSCGRCIRSCPRKNIHILPVGMRGAEEQASNTTVSSR